MAEPTTIEAVIIRVRAWARGCQWTKSRYAAEAGLRDTTLRAFHADSWNPTRETLAKLEAVIPPGWRSGQKVPDRYLQPSKPRGSGR